MSEQLTREDLAAHFRRGTGAAAAAAEPAQPEVTRLTRSRSANRYPGECTSCHQTVNAGEGTVTNVNGHWLVKHVQCPMIEVRSLPRVQSSTGQVYNGPLLPGIYTMTDANGDHVTYRVRVQSTSDTFAPGETIIDFLSGPDNTTDYTSFAFLKNGSLVVWKRFRVLRDSDPSIRHKIDGALALLRDPERADVARTCIRCNALLTTPESIAAGMGPTCRDKGW